MMKEFELLLEKLLSVSSSGHSGFGVSVKPYGQQVQEFQAAREALLRHVEKMSAPAIDVPLPTPILTAEQALDAVAEMVAYGDLRYQAGVDTERERCAVIAWSHYMDNCKAKRSNPADFYDWCCAEVIRAKD